MSKTKVTLIGCGFTGATVALALRSVFEEAEIVGHDKNREASKRALAAKAIDKDEWNLPRAVENAALVVIAIPQDGLELTLKSIQKDLAKNAVVVALGGLSVASLDLARKYLPDDITFVSSSIVFHPERVDANAAPSAAHLKDAIWTMVARGGEDNGMVEFFANLVANMQAVPVFVDAVERDGMALSVDTIPTLLSSLLMLTVSGDDAWREREWMAGADFAAFTARGQHAAELAPQLMAQRKSASHWLNQFMLCCMTLRDALDDNDAKAVEALLKLSMERREKWLSDWRKGRDTGGQPIEKRNSMLGLFIGDRLADRMNRRDDRR